MSNMAAPGQRPVILRGPFLKLGVAVVVLLAAAFILFFLFESRSLSGYFAGADKISFSSVDLNTDRPFLVLKAQAQKAIELVGFTMAPDPAKADVIRFSFYWRKLRNSRIPYEARLGVVDPENRLIHTEPRPLCCDAYPFPKWKVGEVVKEEYTFVVPKRLPGTSYEVRLAVANERTGTQVPLGSRVDGALDMEGRVRLIALDAI